MTLGRIKAYESWDEFEERKSNIVEQNSFIPSAPGSYRSLSDVRAEQVTGFVLHTGKADGLQSTKETIRIGIASMAIRSEALELVVNSLYHQADEIVVYLNDYCAVPEFLNRPKIRAVIGEGDVGDRGKFYDIDNFNGYMLTCDDDIIYPPYYVQHCIDGIERYGRRAAVAWHGSILKDSFDDYYCKLSRRVFSFRAARCRDQPVHILGTGCAAFHTDTLRIRYSEFTLPNMADVYFAVHAQKNKVPLIVLKHDAYQAQALEIENDIAIHKESSQATLSKADTKEEQNRQIIANWPWKLYETQPEFERQTYNICYIGRVDVDRWRKGGILKSGTMLVSAMRCLGNSVKAIDISTPYDRIMRSASDSDIVWIYPGDPERPDFSNVERIIEQCGKLGGRVYVNLSYDTDGDRRQWIRNKLTMWSERYGDRIKACFFTNSALSDPAFKGLEKNLICIPKSIDFDAAYRTSFDTTEGIFLGDLQKLLNLRLTKGRIEDWIEALRKEMPLVPLYCVRQYGGEVTRDLGVEVVPYMVGDDWNAWLSSRRIACCLTPAATYEMVQMEAAGMGVPIIYRPMSQSYTECLSVSGIQVDTPYEFAKACKALYQDSIVWKMYSRSAQLRAQSQHIDLIKAAIHTQIMLKS